MAKNIKHGQAVRGKKSSEYKAWQALKDRCHNPKCFAYDYYGARGIAVCERWKADFASFFEDMGPKPSRRHSINRINNDGNYEPNNCKWDLPRDQMINRRNSRLIEFEGELTPLVVVTERLGIHMNTLRKRLANWPLERALSSPVDKRYAHPPRIG